MTVALVVLAAALLALPSPVRGRLAPAIRRHHSTKAFAPLTIPVIAVIGSAVLSPGLGAAAALLSATAIHRYRCHRESIRRCGEGRHLAAALGILAGELRAGAHPVTAFSAAATESTGAVARAMASVASRARLGADVAAGLREVARESSARAYWERIAVCWQLAAEHGLAMSTLMEAAQRDIIGRQRFGDSIDAGLAGARATAAILASMPVVGVILGQLIGAQPLSFLLGGAAGSLLLTIGAALMCAGVLWSYRIISGVAP